MNLEITLSKEEAIKIYNFLFSTSDVGIKFRPLGCTFMRDLIYPLSVKEGKHTWLFSSGGILWFLDMVKAARASWPDCDTNIRPIVRQMSNAYMAMINELIPDDPDPKSPEATSRPAD